MSDPALGLLMLSLIVVVIMLGFPTAFTLMGLGMFFGYIAFYVPGAAWHDNRVFDLIVERTFPSTHGRDTLLPRVDVVDAGANFSRPPIV